MKTTTGELAFCRTGQLPSIAFKPMENQPSGDALCKVRMIGHVIEPVFPAQLSLTLLAGKYWTLINNVWINS
jgi:hypothetical protein